MQLEDDLLYKLSSAEGDMTEDLALIESLEESKRVADEISEKVAEAKTTEEQINEARNKVCQMGHPRLLGIGFSHTGLHALNKHLLVQSMSSSRPLDGFATAARPQSSKQVYTAYDNALHFQLTQF